MHMDFTGLWNDLPPSTDNLWRNKHTQQKREVLHLLCGALWHLELAAAITDGDFSDDPMEVALAAYANKNPIAPWEPWTSLSPKPPQVEVETSTNGCKLTMS